MNETLLFTVLVLCILGVLSAVILYFVAQKFKVVEDPRIGVVEGMLPAAPEIATNVPGPIFSTEPRPVPWKLPCMPVKLPAHSDAWGKAIA